MAGRKVVFRNPVPDIRPISPHLPTRCQFIAFMPQWDFLDFMAEHAKRYPTFHLRMQAEVKDLVEEDANIVGVRATTPQGPLEVRARLTVGADGRHSTVRERAGLEVQDQGAPIDVLWMRLSRKPGDPDQPLGRFDRGRIFVMLFRGEYWQCGYVIPKGGLDELRRKGIESFRQDIVEIAPFMQGRVGELKDWDDVKLLTVTVDRLKTWHRPGLLCIGDSAHAMSPADRGRRHQPGHPGRGRRGQHPGASRSLQKKGRRHRDDLQVQSRRELPTRLTQRLQVLIQNRVIGRVIGSRAKLTLAWPLKLLRRFPFLRRIPARLIGIGFRPEHVRTPDMFSTQ